MANLIIKVEQIEEPRQLEVRPLTRAFLDDVFLDAPSYKVRAPSELKAHVTRVGETDVLLEGAATTLLESECRRCLRKVESEVPVVFTINLVARKPEPDRGKKGSRRDKQAKAEEEEEVVLSESEQDDELFDGHTIDLTPILREQLLLALPAIEPLCQEACKGLCTVCGQDLNEKDCGHLQKQPDPRWSALKNLKV